MSKIVIIGGGAAGLLCAAKSAEKGNDVVIIEKMNRCGRKLMITGKGRCNVTNASFELDDLISNVPTNPRFLYSAFSNFMPYDTMALFEELGVALKIERGNRVFPVSDKAVDIVDALVNYAKNSGVKIIQGTAKAFEFNNNKINSVVLEDKSKIECDKVCLCTGGKSYHLTGSTGDGYILAKSAGHTIVPPKPSLVPLECSNNFIPKLQGLSLKNIEITLFEDEKAIYSDFGEMIFTHFGVSGPVILSASSHIKNMGKKKYKIKIDLKPALDFNTLDKRICRDFEEFSNKDFVNSLSKLCPYSLACSSTFGIEITISPNTSSCSNDFSFIFCTNSSFSNIGKERTSVALSIFLYSLFIFLIFSPSVSVIVTYNFEFSIFSSLKHCSNTFFIVFIYSSFSAISL